MSSINVNGVQQDYFTSRQEAGALLGKQLVKYKAQETIVLAIGGEGSVLVAAEIASAIDALIAIMATKEVVLPDGRTAVGIINEIGGFIYNNSLSTGEIDELQSEYRSNIELAKEQAMHALHVESGKGSLLSKDYFRNRCVICVVDGTLNGMAFDMASDYLKGIHTQKVIMVAPIASVPAVDRMHVLADELYCLNVIDSVFEVNHYYADNKMPSHDESLQLIGGVINHWHQVHQLSTKAKSV